MAFDILLLGFVLAMLWLSSRVVGSLPAARQDQIRIRGPGLPNGSVRALLVLLIVAAFVVLAFVGDELVADEETHGTVLTGESADGDADDGDPDDEGEPGGQPPPNVTA